MSIFNLRKGRKKKKFNQLNEQMFVLGFDAIQKIK